MRTALVPLPKEPAGKAAKIRYSGKWIHASIILAGWGMLNSKTGINMSGQLKKRVMSYRKKRRMRNTLRSIALSCTLGIGALMPLKADAGVPDISGLMHADKKKAKSSIHISDPASDPAEKGESGFRPLERSELSLDFRLGRMKGLDVSLIPYGYSWKLQEIPFGGGLLLRLGRPLFGGEWNGRDGGLFILGYFGSLGGKRLEVVPRLYLAPQHPAIGGRLRIGFRINKQTRIYSDSYIMSSGPGQANSMNFMVGLSFGR